MGQTSRKNFSVVLRHGRTCSKKMRGNGLANWQTRRRSNCRKFLILAWTITKSKKNWKTKGELSKVDEIYALFRKVWNVVERSFVTKVHSEKSMNVSDVNVTDEDDFLSRSKNDQSEQQDCEETIRIPKMQSMRELLRLNTVLARRLVV